MSDDLAPECPNCGADDYEVWDIDEWSDKHYKECICLQCDEEFTLIYQLIATEVRD